MHTYAHAHTLPNTHTHNTHIQTCVHTICTRTSKHMYTHMYTYAHAHTHTSKHTYNTHKHTHTHTHRCVHCHSVDRIFREAAIELALHGVKLARVDTSKETTLKQKYQIAQVPTFKVFRKGQMFNYDGPSEDKGAKGPNSPPLPPHHPSHSSPPFPLTTPLLPLLTTPPTRGCYQKNACGCAMKRFLFFFVPPLPPTHHPGCRHC